MVTGEGHRNRHLPGLVYLLFSLLTITGMVVLAAFTIGIREDTALGFLAPYRQYLVAVVEVLEVGPVPLGGRARVPRGAGH